MQYFAPKGRKKLQDISHPFVVYNPHTVPLEQRHWDQEDVWYVASIDPGLVHLAIRVESRNRKTGEIKPLLMVKNDVYANYEAKTDAWINQSVNIIDDILSRNSEILLNCHMWIIEKQLGINYKSLTLSKQIIMWAHLYLKNRPRLPLIIEYESKQKYRMFNAPPFNQKELKKWGIGKALELLQHRNDQQSIYFINHEPISKRDDLADTVLLIEAFFKYMGWPETIVTVTIDLNCPPSVQTISVQGQGQVAVINPEVVNYNSQATVEIDVEGRHCNNYVFRQDTPVDIKLF